MADTHQVLLLGKDGRTDAIAAACLASPQQVEITALTQYKSAGLLAKCAAVVIGDLEKLDVLRDLLSRRKFDLAIIGPEEPLAAGATDFLESAGIPTVGPTKALARIETSKVWARELLEKYGIPGNPVHRVFTDTHGLMDYLVELGEYAVKPDGLSGGKGVRVFGDHLCSHSESFEYAAGLISASNCVVVEERLDGEEFSLQTFTDGESVLHCPVVQDHKRAFEGDTGPNTGGMGSYSCPDGSLPFLQPAELEAARDINERVIQALRTETGVPYRGVLYGGFMATGAGIRLIEYNARLGDPEAMNVLTLMQGDFLDLCYAITQGRLAEVDVRFAPLASVCKYVVPEDYPFSKGAGDLITVSQDRLRSSGAYCYWAAAEERGDETMLTSSRTVAFVGVGSTLDEAERRAEDGVSSVVGNVRHRRDIGTPDAIGRRCEHMSIIRGKSRPDDAHPLRRS
ncbi:MAG: phosphoribosylamine--glycine ligase [Micromonosporaceae bacterium]